MAGRLSIDFGTSNTVVGLWDTDSAQGRSVDLPGFSSPDIYNGQTFHCVPSLIHYNAHRVQIGHQVLDQDLESNPATFRWMKTYIGNGMKLPRTIGSRSVDFFLAGQDFLRQVILSAGTYTDLSNEEVAFTVPVEAFEQYQNWLDGVVRGAGVARPVFIDEPSAAALGYSAKIRPGQAFVVFDFGGGTADASVVKVEDGSKQLRCRALGKAGAQLGGSMIDHWMVREVLVRTGNSEQSVRPFMGMMLWEAERVKKSLSERHDETFTVMDPDTGSVITHYWTRSALDDLLDSNGLYAKINSVLDLAESQAREYGYERDVFHACLMIGGSCLIPSVRRIVRARYGDRVMCDRPFEAVALGAAAYVAGVGFDDRIRHEYALRPYDRSKKDYVFQTIVKSGTAYPCDVMKPDRPDERLVITIKASNDQQTRLGLQVYEVTRKEFAACGGNGFDIVFGPNGDVRYMQREDPEDVRSRQIGSMTFIIANPPAELGDPRFQATFRIDHQKRLCITVKDTKINKTLMWDQPMVTLT